MTESRSKDTCLQHSQGILLLEQKICVTERQWGIYKILRKKIIIVNICVWNNYKHSHFGVSKIFHYYAQQGCICMSILWNIQFKIIIFIFLIFYKYRNYSFISMLKRAVLLNFLRKQFLLVSLMRIVKKNYIYLKYIFFGFFNVTLIRLMYPCWTKVLISLTILTDTKLLNSSVYV